MFLFIITNVFSQTSNPVASVDDKGSAIISESDEQNNASETLRTQQEEEQNFFLDDADTQAIEVEPFGVWNTIKIFLVLIVLLLIGVGLVWFLKKMQVSQNSTNEEVIDVVSSKVLTQGTALHVVKLGTGFLLVSSTSSTVNLIKDYTSKEDLDEIILAISKAESQARDSSTRTGAKTFLQKLQKKLSSTNNQVLLSSANNNTSVLSLFRGVDKGGKL